MKRKKCKKQPFNKNKYEIMYNLVNSGIAGVLVFLGAFTNGGITKEALLTSIVASLMVAVVQFRDYWAKEESEYSSKRFLKFL